MALPDGTRSKNSGDSVYITKLEAIILQQSQDIDRLKQQVGVLQRNQR